MSEAGTNQELQPETQRSVAARPGPQDQEGTR